MTIYELDTSFTKNLGKTALYKETEIIGKDYPDDFLTPGKETSFLILNKEKAWIVHADSLVSVAEELEGYLGMSVDDFIMISLGTQYHERFKFNDDYEIWEKYFVKLREAYYSDQWLSHPQNTSVKQLPLIKKGDHHGSRKSYGKRR